MMQEPLKRGFVAAQVGEALANYALADQPLHERPEDGRDRTRDSIPCRDDKQLWQLVFRHYGPDHAEPAMPLNLYMFQVAVSEWIARVPGLFWRPEAVRTRERPAQIESETGGWRVYTPQGKSGKVLGGVGTLRLPPAEDGYRLVTITANYNASAGVPALISPDVWEHHRLGEGSNIVHGTAFWRDMPQKWAAQFPVIEGIPRGCLVLDKVDAIQGVEQRAPVLIHPFSIMEYWEGDMQLHDFVYATADSREPGFRDELSGFFEAYRKDKDRDGRYLTAADIANPMWDAVFSDPEDMRARKAAELRLIERRVAEAAKGQDVVAALLRKLCTVGDIADLKRLSEKAGIRWRRWSRGGSIAEESTRLVQAAVEDEMEQPLLYAVQLEIAP